MLVVQQNCGKGYECTISALEAGLGLNASVVCIQEPFLGNRSLAHAGFNLYWPSGTADRKDMRVLIAVRKWRIGQIWSVTVRSTMGWCECAQI